VLKICTHYKVKIFLLLSHFEDVVSCYFLELDAQKVGFFHYLRIQVILLAELVTLGKSLIWGATSLVVNKVKVVSHHLCEAYAVTLF